MVTGPVLRRVGPPATGRLGLGRCLSADSVATRGDTRRRPATKPFTAVPFTRRRPAAVSFSAVSFSAVSFSAVSFSAVSFSAYALGTGAFGPMAVSA
jgi:hypothetical protein